MTAPPKITDIIQKRVKCFTKEKYISLFEDILRNEINYNNYINENNYNKSINNSLTTIIKNYENKKILKNKNIWYSITKYLFVNDTKYNMIPSLVIQYLKLKSKMIIPKLLYISSRNKHPLDFILDKYIDLCKYEILKIKALKKKIHRQKNLRLNNLLSNNSNKGKTIPLTDRSQPKTDRKFSSIIENEIKKNEFEQEETIDENPLNLFIGNFNIQSFKEHNQSVYMKKYDNISTFIFVNKEDPNNPNFQNNPYTRTFVSKKGGKEHVVSMPKIYGKRGSMNIHRFDSFSFFENDINEHVKETRNAKNKKPSGILSPKNNFTISFANFQKGNRKSKKLTIKIDRLPDEFYNNINKNNVNFSKQYCNTEGLINKDLNDDNINIFKKKSKVVHKYDTNQCRIMSGVNNENKLSLSRKNQEKLIRLNTPDNNSNTSKKSNKSRNVIKVKNFFSKTDLYY